MSGRAGSRRRWGVVRVEVPERIADELAGSVGGGSLGVEVVEGGPGRATLSTFVETEDEACGVADRVRRVLDEILGPEESSGAPVVETVVDDRWVERYEQRLRPLPLGSRFVVLPLDAEDPTESGRIAIRIVPGRAFGTGEHPTTRLCAAFLEERVSPGSLWVDVGTGSGILAIVAAHCGARRVVAVDVDPDAIDVARKWIARNGVDAIVDPRASGIVGLSGEAADGVVVNISATYLESDADTLARVLRGGGELIASGFPIGELDDVSRVLQAAGFREAIRSETEGWACLLMRMQVAGEICELRGRPWGG